MPNTAGYWYERDSSTLLWVGLGLILGLVATPYVYSYLCGEYLFWTGQEDTRTAGVTRLGSPWGIRGLSLFEATALLITKARLQLYRLAPSRLRLCLYRLCGARYSPDSKANRMFLLRHDSYSEKLRWTLELSGEQFDEVCVPVFATRPTAMFHSLGTSDKLPLVSTNEGSGGTRDPAVLIERLSKARWRAWMYPEGARELELKLEHDFGRAAMHVAYTYLIEQDMLPETMEMLSRGLPWWQRLLMPTLGVGVLSNMDARFGFTEEMPGNIKIIERTFRLIENILSDGRLYLCGDSISAADIAFASFSFPVLLPDETDGIFVSYNPRTLPREYVEIIKRLRARTGGAFALRLYSQKRLREGQAPPSRSPRRGRSFTLKKNVNSPTHVLNNGRGGRRATVNGKISDPTSWVPKRLTQRRTTIIG